MNKSKVIEMKPVSLFEVKEVLKTRKGEVELNYEQEQTYKYVEKFARLTEKQTRDLLDGLEKIDFLKELELFRFEIANTVPTRIEQLQLMLPKGLSPSAEELNSVLELTKKFEEKFQ